MSLDDLRGEVADAQRSVEGDANGLQIALQSVGHRTIEGRREERDEGSVAELRQPSAPTRKGS